MARPDLAIGSAPVLSPGAAYGGARPCLTFRTGAYAGDPPPRQVRRTPSTGG